MERPQCDTPLVVVVVVFDPMQNSVFCNLFRSGSVWESTVAEKQDKKIAGAPASAQDVILIMAQEQADDVANDNRVRELLSNFYGSPSSSDSQQAATMERLRRLDSLQQIDFAEFDPDHYMNSLVWQFFLTLCCRVVLFVLCCSFYKEMSLYSSWILICC